MVGGGGGLLEERLEETGRASGGFNVFGENGGVDGQTASLRYRTILFFDDERAIKDNNIM